MKQYKSLIAGILLTIASTAVVIAQQLSSLEPSVAKLQQHISYLASDALQGRRTGTSGANDAAHYIAGEFSRLGLHPGIRTATAPRKPRIALSQYLQPFPYVAGVSLGKGNELILAGSVQRKPVQVGRDWMPLGFSANGTVPSTPVAFVGYGITASELNHDDYANNQVKGRIALALAGTPDGDNPHGQFARYEGVRWKAIAARNAGAKALLIVTREANLKDDGLSQLTYDNSAGDAGLPVAVVSQELIGGPAMFDRFEEGAQKGQKIFDENSTASISIDLVRNETPAYNVVGVLEGSDPLLKNEVIVVGAHYDHLGLGGEGSLASRAGDVHHGADDNASGVAGVLELARMFTAQQSRPKRTIAFIAFSGEEEGLLGSNYYVNHPLLPLTSTVAMINMDMIGRLRERKLIIGGVGTAKEWRDLINNTNLSTRTASGNTVMVPAGGGSNSSANPGQLFDLTLQEDGYGPSDHSSFYAKQIPVLFFWTGNHEDYHKPSDTFDKINYEGEAQLVSFVARLVRDLDHAEKRVTYSLAKSDASQRTGGFRVYLGTIPNYADTGDGLLLDGIRDGSPAAKAGMKAGDRVIKIGEHDIKNVYDYTFALGEMKAGQEYSIVVMRGSEKLSLKIIPDARK